jgi:hypothetical protein
MSIIPANPTPGQASFNSDTVSMVPELFAGDSPDVVTVSGSYNGTLATAGIPIWTPVDLDFETGAISLVDGTTITKANAITVGEVPAGSVAGRMPLYKAGAFNINALNWPASLATEAARLAGFDLAACQIYVKKPYYA